MEIPGLVLLISGLWAALRIVNALERGKRIHRGWENRTWKKGEG